jgi:putative ABC transport system permease protein
MWILENIRIAIISIYANRMRSVLTTLGIVIGVGAIIVLISLGQGVDTFVKGEFLDLGVNIILVSATQPKHDRHQRIEPLTTEDIISLQNTYIASSVSQVGGEFNVLGYLSANGEHLRTTVHGVTPNMLDMMSWGVSLGSFITDQHVHNIDRVAVLGVGAVEKLFGYEDANPIGEIIRLNDQAFTVIGVMESRSFIALGTEMDENSIVFVPISTAQTRLAQARVRGGFELTLLYVQSTSEKTSASASDEIDHYLYEKHKIDTKADKDYSITNAAALLEIVGEITMALTVFLGLIAGVSMLVGGIGIMNIMLVTVTERTHEIGLRKAVGARPFDILTQFLIESVLLSLIGGSIGILVGWALTSAISSAVPDLVVTVAAGTILLVVGISCLVGIGFGMLPANRAAHMHPIDALRYE